ncbi:hypothetical protein GCM10007966_07930 [Legionella impletisoli]|uniref:Uncharacterized protein n=2 Tax=Legionella impletisoli TaxID=343510 RepID=A0A917JQS2_9GAMM|nr:hypothetical protein GCM10007966_07930 [Legionella impletisoli]
MKHIMTGIAGMVLLVGTGFANLAEKEGIVYFAIAIETPDGTKAHAVMSKEQYDKIKDKDLKKGVNVKLNYVFWGSHGGVIVDRPDPPLAD